jgi:hypothetical protein
MKPITLAKLLSFLALLPGLIALLVAVSSSNSASPFSVWCVAHCWQLFVACVILHFIIRLFAFLITKRAAA